MLSNAMEQILVAHFSPFSFAPCQSAIVLSPWLAVKMIEWTLLVKAMKETAGARFEDTQVILPSARETSVGANQSGYIFHSLPLWGFFALVTLITLLAIEAGQQLGARRRRVAKHEPEGMVGTVVGAVLGLLAFLIALTFGAASNRFDARREALLDDVDAIKTAYLSTSLLPEPTRTATRSLLRDYVKIRIAAPAVYSQPDKLRAGRARCGAPGIPLVPRRGPS
jgi:hypothetical protein